MTIKVQGETYNSPAEILTAIGELGAQLEDLPETHPGRADLERHIERLRDAVGDQPVTDSISPGGEPQTNGGDSLSVAPPESPPLPDADEEDEDPDADPVPPGYVLCPVCKQGVLTADAPVSQTHERCDGCNGFGKVLTGSHVEGHTTVSCPDCQGNGYITRRDTYSPRENGNPTPAPSPAWPGSTWNAEESRWEPPIGDPPWTGAIWDAVRGAYA